MVVPSPAPRANGVGDEYRINEVGQLRIAGDCLGFMVIRQWPGIIACGRRLGRRSRCPRTAAHTDDEGYRNEWREGLPTELGIALKTVRAVNQLLIPRLGRLGRSVLHPMTLSAQLRKRAGLPHPYGCFSASRRD